MKVNPHYHEYRKKLSEYQTKEMREESSRRMKASKLKWDQEKTDKQEEEAKKTGLSYTRLDSKLLILKYLFVLKV